MAQSVEESGRLYREALDASRDQREQIREDLEFSDPSDPQQWDLREKQARENDPGGRRPCLVFDQTGQYIANVAGQVEQRPPGLHAIPAGGGADKRVAEQYDGHFRHIEHASRAPHHYARALTSAARTGVGYLIVRPDHVDRALNWQEPRISSEGDPLRVVLDPWSVELDGSDANFGYLLTPYSHREFERQFGKNAAKVNFGDEEQRYVSDDRQSVLVAEEWCAEDVRTNVIIVSDLDAGGDELSLSEDEYWQERQKGRNLQYLGNYMDRRRVVYWRKLSGVAVLQEAKDRETGKTMPYPASGIGIVPVYGYVGFTDGRMRYCGIPRRARAPQQAYNYHMSEMRVLMGQAAKAPYLMPLSALGGDANIKLLWERAAVESRAFLPYQDRDEQGGPVNAPTRIQPAINLQNHIAGSIQAREDIQASIGMYAANIGKQSNAQSGVAYDAQKQQGEASTAHFPGNLAASIAQVGRLCLEMIPRLIDTKRQIRILGSDGTPGVVTADPKAERAVTETREGLVINPNVGRYDVRVTVGASFSTQRQDTNMALTEMIRANPQMMPVIGPLWAKSLDFPDSDKLAQVLAAIAPPEVKAILQPGGQEDEGPSKAEMAAQLEQLKTALQQAIKTAREAEQDLDECQAKLADKEAEAEIRAYEAETKRMVGLKHAISPDAIQALVAQTLEQMLSSPAPMAGEREEAEEPEGEPTSFEMQPMPADFGQAQELAPIEQEPM